MYEVSEHKDLHEANVILKKCHTRIEVKKSLRKRHLMALLRDLNAPADLLKSGRDVMFQAYWERREGESGDNDVSIIERTSKPHALASCTSRMNSYHHVSSPIHRLPSLITYTRPLHVTTTQMCEHTHTTLTQVSCFQTGDKIVKMFSGRLFRGHIVRVRDEEGEVLYHVTYEDGDSEDLDAEECDRAIKLRKGVDSGDINEWDLGNE